MANWNDVRQTALALPATEEKESWGSPSWRVRDKAFAWGRPMRPADEEALGKETPKGPTLAVRVADEGVKLALVADDPEIYFTTPHFNGYPAVLVRLDKIKLPELKELLTEAWLLRAPKKLAKEYLTDHPIR